MRRNFSVVDMDDHADAAHTDSPSAVTWTSLGLEQPMVIAMVGLPARGKSYLTALITRFLRWMGYEVQLFNVGSYRRKIGLQSADSSFFAAGNSDGQRVREEMAMAVQDAMYQWLHESNDSDTAKRRVAIFDATNTTISRRLALAQKARKENVFLLFVESICDDAKVLAQNYELKLQNDDYKGMDAKKARQDFLDRVAAYERVYQTIQDDEDSNNISYIKLINVGQKVITRNCNGYLPSQVAFYLQNVHIQERSIYLSLNAENFDLVEDSGRLGGAESGRLTEAGREYSRDIARYLQAKHQEAESVPNEQQHAQARDRDLLVLAGTAKVHAETLLHLRMLFSCYNTPLLNELRGGDMHTLSKEEIRTRFPQEYANREADKLRYRYPGVGGESYLDVIERIRYGNPQPPYLLGWSFFSFVVVHLLFCVSFMNGCRPVIIELERQRRSVLVVCHLAVLRCIHAYFMGIPLEEIPYKPFQRHVIYELSPGPFGCTCREISPREELSSMYL